MSAGIKAGKVFLTMALYALFAGGVLASAPAAQYREACGTSGWYFAEGYTGGDFDTWILIQNPNAVETTATVRLFTPEGELDPLEVPLGGQTRTSVYLNSVPGLQEGKEVAAEVKVEGSGIIAERAMYFDYGGGRAGGHSSIGAASATYNWYLPEGYTGGEFDTYVLLMNPGTEDANGVWVKLMKPQDGRYYPFKVDVPAGRRVTIKLDDLVWTEGSDNYITATNTPPAEPQQVRFDSTDVSTYICSSKPLVAERSMYFDYYGRAGGSSSIGATSAAPAWYLPEGYTGGLFDTWVMSMNPNDFPVDITYTFYSNQPGFEPVSVTHEDVPAYSRDTIFLDGVPGLEGTDVSTKVTAKKDVELQAAEASDPVERYAVLYGVEDYPDPASDLLYSEDDVCDLKHRLVDYCGFTYDRMRYRTGSYATTANLASDMAWLAANADANDIVLFYFAGNSSQDAEGNYADLYDGCVSTAQLDAYFDALPADKLLALFDCDDAWTFLADLAVEGRLLAASGSFGEKRHEYADAAFSAAAAESGDSGNGAFTHYFVEALAKQAADASGNGLVSAEEAFAYAAPRTTALVLAQEEPDEDQAPAVSDNIAGEVDLTVEQVDANIVAERSVYFQYGNAGDGATSVGTSSLCNNWFLAEGYTGGGFDTWVLVMNPYDNWQKLHVTYMTPEGTTVEKEYDCPPRYRYSIKVDDQDPLLAATDVSTRVEACYMDPPGASSAGCTDGSSGVAVERAMYFVYYSPGGGSPKSGGTCSIGFGE